MTSTTGHTVTTSRQAAERTKKFLNSPIRLGVPATIMATFLALLSLMYAEIIPEGWGWPIAIAVIVIFGVGEIFTNRGPQPGHRPGTLSEPFRPDPNSWPASSIAPAFMIPGVIILGNATNSLVPKTSTPVAVIVAIVIAVAIATAIMLSRKIGLMPRATSLPEDFNTRYNYSPDSAEAAVLAVLHVGGAPRRVAYRDCLPYFTSLDDATLTEALHRITEDGLIRVTDNYTALTEKNRNRQLVQLEAAA